MINKLLRYLGYYHKDDLASYRELWYSYGVSEGIKIGQQDKMIEAIDAQIENAVASTRTKPKKARSSLHP